MYWPDSRQARAGSQFALGKFVIGEDAGCVGDVASSEQFTVDVSCHVEDDGTVKIFAVNTAGDVYISSATDSTIAEVLGHYGYATAAFGKDHNTPVDQLANGPYDRTPTARGFDYISASIPGETPQHEPAHWGMVLVSRRAGAPVSGSVVVSHSVALASGLSPVSEGSMRSAGLSATLARMAAYSSSSSLE